MGLIYSTGKGLGQKTAPLVIHPDRVDRIQTPRLSSNRVSWERGQKRLAVSFIRYNLEKTQVRQGRGLRHSAVSDLQKEGGA